MQKKKAIGEYWKNKDVKWKAMIGLAVIFGAAAIITIYLPNLFVCGRDWPYQKCGSFPDMKNRLSFPIQYPQSYADFADKSAAVSYYILREPQQQSSQPVKLVNLGYSICIDNRISDFPPCSSIELRGIVLSQTVSSGKTAAQSEICGFYDPEYQDLTVKPAECLSHGKIIRYYAFRDHHDTPVETARKKGIHVPADSGSGTLSDSVKNSGLFQYFSAYWVDGNYQYSIWFRNFFEETNQRNISGCLSAAEKYYDDFKKEYESLKSRQ